mgnify:CR=1 FL=1
MASTKLPICFVIGSPRSGTTILNDVLDRHPEIESISEPYFIWDWYSGGGDDDLRGADDADERTREFVRAEFARTLQKSDKRVLVEKTPENCFRIPYMKALFPEAKWIYLYRDGRDVIVSMDKEWRRRKHIVENRSVAGLVRTAWRMLSRQKYWRNRFLALRHELARNLSLNPQRFFNKAKWKGRAAWGPRFPGWEEALDNAESSVLFNAIQWKECIRYSTRDLETIDDAHKMTVSYEAMVTSPETVLGAIATFLGVTPQPELGHDLSPSSIGNWRTRFEASELRAIERIIAPEMRRLGYEPETTAERSDS